MEHRVISVHLRESYNVLIGGGLLAKSGSLIRVALGDCRLAVVTDCNVAGLYLDGVLTSLREAGYDTCSFVFPAGEQSKRMDTLSNLLEFFAEERLTRTDCVLALGGGVTGDLAGFAAGCYLRGIRYVQLPTTLLAAVDSSIGGKTAIDLPQGKNLAGLFHQPSLVLCDIDCFHTLPAEELSNGAAEAIKTGILEGEPLFSLLETGNVREHIEPIVTQCVRYKANIVGQDETETGPRKLLNLGHTVGHAIEKCSGFSIPHGYAVAIGLAIIARAAESLGAVDEPIAARIESALVRNGLPITTKFSPEALANAALSDKKRTGGQITLVVPRAIGACYFLELPTAQLENFFRAGMEAGK